jgi:hypothetical protein
MLHIAALGQIRRPGEGRSYYRRMLGEAKAKKEALRYLKRRLSHVVYRQRVADVNLLENTARGQAEPGRPTACRNAIARAVTGRTRGSSPSFHAR